MARRLLLLLVLGALALVLASCDASVVPYAAKVGSASIPVSQLNSVLQAFRDDSALRCAYSANGVTIDGVGKGNFSSSFTSARLTDLIELQLYSSIFSKLGLQTDDYSNSIAQSQLEATFGPSQVGSCATSGTSFFDSIPEAYRNVVVGLQEHQVVLEAHLAGAELSPGGIADYESTHRPEMTTACLSVILLSSKSEADAIVKELRAGANFASVAMAHSLDTSSAPNGGAIGCIVPGALVPPISTAVATQPTGKVSDPVSFNGQWLVFVVTKREGLASVGDASTAIFDSESSSSTLALAAEAKREGVTVNPNYGSWTGASAGAGASVTPPSGPPDSLLFNSTAITPASPSSSPSP